MYRRIYDPTKHLFTLFHNTLSVKKKSVQKKVDKKFGR